MMSGRLTTWQKMTKVMALTSKFQISGKDKLLKQKQPENLIKELRWAQNQIRCKWSTELSGSQRGGSFQARIRPFFTKVSRTCFLNERIISIRIHIMQVHRCVQLPTVCPVLCVFTKQCVYIYLHTHTLTHRCACTERCMFVHLAYRHMHVQCSSRKQSLLNIY